MSDALSHVQSVYACFGRGDIPALLERLAPQVVWQFIADRRAPFTGRFVGQARVAEWFGHVARSDGIQAFEPREFLVGADHVTVIGWERTQALPAGAVFETEWVHVWQLDASGLVTRFLGIYDSEAASIARG
ncbi:MAG: nuclear transport factor 2 family protein [Burkholderiales bacterium]|nr:nuclear transport factor 2 family protein [Burkholderiales bacterium]